MIDELKQENEISVGINKAIFQKRLDLKMTRKEAALKLNISVLRLTVVERGYLKIGPKLKNRFIEAYDLDESFFFDNYEYPIVINEKIYKNVNTNTIFDKIGKSKLFRYICLGIAAIFTGISIYGATLIPGTLGNPSQYYTQEIIDVHNNIISQGKPGNEKDFLVNIEDSGTSSSYHFIKTQISESRNVCINSFDTLNLINYLFFDGVFYETNSNNQKVSFSFNNRFMGGDVTRMHFMVSDVETGEEGKETLIHRCSITCDVKYNRNNSSLNYNYSSVVKLTGGQGNRLLNSNDPEYIQYTSDFERLCPEYGKACEIIFTSGSLQTKLTYSDFCFSFNECSSNFSNGITLCMCLTFVSLLLVIVALGLWILSFIERHSVANKALKFISDVEEDKEVPTKTIEREPDMKPLPRNKWKDLFVPEFFVRVLSLGLLFASSIATYFLFVNVVRNDSLGITASVYSKQLVSNLSVIAIMLLYFVKMDIYQNKKSALATTIFYLILGLIYYLALVIIYYLLVGMSDSMASITNAIFDVLPGNIVWGVVVFNMIMIFMFAPVDKRYNNDKKKIITFRMLTIVPFSYLIASTIIYFGIKAGGWKMPYAVSSLFFYKAPMITVFAIFYCVAVFIYRKFTLKKYGNINGQIFQKSNKYNYIRNFIAALIVLGIGLFDLICLFCWKDNAFGFGSNYLMLGAIPFIIFYHPHIGHRNGMWDGIFNTLYCIAYILGIVLIIIAIIVILATL